MRVILTVTGGPCEGRKTWLRPAQSVTVGRSPSRAYFALDGDSRLEDVHFTVHCQVDKCIVESVGGETWLNGQTITTARLRDGDVLAAGSSRIAVILEGAAGLQDVTPPAEPTAAAATSRERSHPVRRRFDVSAMRLESGGYCYRLRADAAQAAQVVRSLAGSANTHLITAPDELLQPAAARQTLLFNWLPENCAHVSPKVALEFSQENVEEILTTAVGRNALTFVFSALTGEELTTHLRSAARGRLAETDEPREQNLLLTFEPNLLEERLPSCDARFTSSFFSHVEALFFESRTEGEWLVMSGKQQTELLQQVEKSAAPPSPGSTGV